MPIFDLSLAERQHYRPSRDEPPDFDDFWAETRTTSRAAGSDPRFEEVTTPLRTVHVFDVTFSGYLGQPIRGWLLLPVIGARPLPAVVEYLGYGGGRGFPFNWLIWASAGYAHFVMDTRGQGAAWSPGETVDRGDDGTGPSYPGVMTKGIWDPHTYYYRRLMTDAVLALDAVASRPEVDPERLIVCGGSQGGGLALAASGLSNRVRAALIDTPFLCHYRRALEVTDQMPYGELTRFLAIHRLRADDVFRTLSYFDGLNFAARATAPALFSVGLKDEITPPSTVFAAYNHYAGERELKVWPFNGHDAGALDHQVERFAFLGRLAVSPAPQSSQ
jgi:cephalosporin-C deacetylase